MTCNCHKTPINTKFCPDCGRRIPEPKKMYRAEGGGKAVKTSEFREPRKGEYYLSGCKGWEIAYKAPNDLGTRYRIMELV